MLGAIAGDIIGSTYEVAGIKTTEFPLFGPKSQFTDDTVLTVAVADCLLRDRPFAEGLRAWARAHPQRGYGGTFFHWMLDDRMGPYQSMGNGAGMRVSPVGFALDSLDAVLETAAATARPTHDHPEGIKGAQAIAASVFLARAGFDKLALRDEIERRFGYDLHRTVDAIRPGYAFDVTCPGSVPEAIIAFLDSTDLEGAIRLGVSLGGDADTIASMAGAIAQAYYRAVPAAILREVEARLTPDVAEVLGAFERRFAIRYDVI